MTPQEFIRKWKPVALTERSSAHQHFLDLCRLFDHPTPAEDDPVGDHFTFEKGAPKTGGGEGWADVWKKGFFAWEYKKKKRDLDKALEQLTRYAAALENPPLHVACDTHIFRIETRWTNEAAAKYEFELEELADPVNLARLRAVFHNPEELRSGRTREKLTKEAADKFQTISDSLQHRNPDKEAVAHFVNQLVFCFFADSVSLLPNGVWKKLLQTAERRPEKAKQWLDQLFADMKDGGDFNLEHIAWFNGGLFDGRPALSLTHTEISLLFEAARLDWSLIDPTIFGTLFERFLDPGKRKQIGAHYTDPDKIMMIVEPVVLRPLKSEWEAAKAKIAAIMAPALEAVGENGKSAKREQGKRFDAARARAEAERDAFVGRLCTLRIFDPACGSGNFLYLALQGVKDIEWRAILDCEALGLGMIVPRVGPEILRGLEINPLAAELARTTIWIGDIQWRVQNAIHHHPSPLLRKLDSIECRDALIAPDGKDGFVEAEWPEADFIIGNPPFLGSKEFLSKLGDDYCAELRQIFADRVAATADLVVYWFYKAAVQLERHNARSFGFVATNKIRRGANQFVVGSIVSKFRIFSAWSDLGWVVEGANVRVSLVCVSSDAVESVLDGAPVAHIGPELNSGISESSRPQELSENAGCAFVGSQKDGPFDIAGQQARDLICLPLNPNGKGNEAVIRPWLNGRDLAGRRSDTWIIDFDDMHLEEAALFEAPFKRVEQLVKPQRAKNRDDHRRLVWWLHGRPGSRAKAAIAGLIRIILTPLTSKHRWFVFGDKTAFPDNSVVVIARGDLPLFGILSSTYHCSWARRAGNFLGVGNDPRYTPTTTFETFPFPEGLTPNIPAADTARDPRAQRIAAAAKALDDLRRAWLNPPDLVDIVPEMTPTAAPGEAPRRYPDRILPKNEEAAAKLKERTLTNLYNQRPRWLADAHDALDRAVAAAYGWPEDIATDDALARLLALNLERAKVQGR